MTHHEKALAFADSNTTPYVYVIIRRDLSFEQQIVQTNHACVAAARFYDNAVANTHLVLLEAKDEDELLMISKRLAAQDIGHEVFYEPDNAIGYSALATEPLINERRKSLRRYRLYRSYKARDENDATMS
jgi:hypothetical protein